VITCWRMVASASSTARITWKRLLLLLSSAAAAAVGDSETATAARRRPSSSGSAMEERETLLHCATLESGGRGGEEAALLPQPTPTHSHRVSSSPLRTGSGRGRAGLDSTHAGGDSEESQHTNMTHAAGTQENRRKPRAQDRKGSSFPTRASAGTSSRTGFFVSCEYSESESFPASFSSGKFPSADISHSYGIHSPVSPAFHIDK